MKMLYTIGHSNHDLPTFLNLLKDVGIECIWDVRSKPYSIWTPHFNKQFLQTSLNKIGIDYKSVLALGGLDDSIPQEVYEKALDDLIKKSGEEKIAVMCSEGKHRDCHRWQKIARDAEPRGVKVIHITTKGELVEDIYPVPAPSLF